MAVKKKTNGHDPVTAEMLEVLKSIDRRIDAMDVRFTKALGEAIIRIDGTNERLDKTNERLDETNERLDKTNERLEKTNEGLEKLRDETRSSLLDIHADLHEANARENLRDREAREDRREHEARIVRLEEHVFRKTG